MDVRGGATLYEFGLFRADSLKRQLSFDGIPLPLTSKAFDTLIMLVSNQGETVTRNELIDAIWEDTAVEENNLTQQISALRKVLGEHPGEHKFIVTRPGRGYSFVAPVRQISAKRYDEIETHQPAPVNGLDEREAILAVFDKNRLIGYGLAVWLIATVCFPVLFSYFRHLSPANRPQRLAVLEFRSNRGDQFIGTGISDTLRARLGSVQDLIVRPLPADAAFQDIIAAGRELNVDAVLTGSVQRADERIRVTVEMVDVGNGRIVWAKIFDSSSSNLFELQDSIVDEVALFLQVRLASQVFEGIPGGSGTFARAREYDLLIEASSNRRWPLIYDGVSSKNVVDRSVTAKRSLNSDIDEFCYHS